jgi:predicted transcriptional regulator
MVSSSPLSPRFTAVLRRYVMQVQHPKIDFHSYRDIFRLSPATTSLLESIEKRVVVPLRIQL